MSYPEESHYWKGRGMDSSQSEPVVSSNGQGDAPPTDPVTWAIFCSDFHPSDVLDGTAAKKWWEWGDHERGRYERHAVAARTAIATMERRS